MSLASKWGNSALFSSWRVQSPPNKQQWQRISQEEPLSRTWSLHPLPASSEHAPGHRLQALLPGHQSSPAMARNHPKKGRAQLCPAPLSNRGPVYWTVAALLEALVDHTAQQLQKATAYRTSCIIEAALRPADIGRRPSLFLRPYAPTCPLERSGGSQIQVQLINDEKSNRHSIVYMIIFGFFRPFMYSVCVSRSIIQDKYDPVNAAGLQPWPPSAAAETPTPPEEWSIPFTRRSMLHQAECANSDTSDPIRHSPPFPPLPRSSRGGGVKAGEGWGVDGGVFRLTAFVLRASRLAKEQLCEKRRQEKLQGRGRQEGRQAEVRLEEFQRKMLTNSWKKIGKFEFCD